MDATSKAILWRQFGAAIDMLENAMQACPDELWSDPSHRPQWVRKNVVGFWYVAYHTLFWLDFYLSDSREGFTPPPPFTLDELDPEGLLPERPYAKAELQAYLDHGRRKCRSTIQTLTDEKATRRCDLARSDVSFAELLLRTMRHVQHHAAQLNLILRQGIDSSPGWVSKAKSNLSDE